MAFHVQKRCLNSFLYAIDVDLKIMVQFDILNTCKNMF